MGNISGFDALAYGGKLFGWLLLVGTVGSIVSGFGFVLAAGGADLERTLVGGYLFLTGGLLVAAGTLGLLYKVVVDALEAGAS